MTEVALHPFRIKQYLGVSRDAEFLAPLMVRLHAGSHVRIARFLLSLWSNHGYDATRG